jgi:hypothetical protein
LIETPDPTMYAVTRQQRWTRPYSLFAAARYLLPTLFRWFNMARRVINALAALLGDGNMSELAALTRVASPGISWHHVT